MDQYRHQGPAVPPATPEVLQGRPGSWRPEKFSRHPRCRADRRVRHGIQHQDAGITEHRYGLRIGGGPTQQSTMGTTTRRRSAPLVRPIALVGDLIALIPGCLDRCVACHGLVWKFGSSHRHALPPKALARGPVQRRVGVPGVIRRRRGPIARALVQPEAGIPRACRAIRCCPALPTCVRTAGTLHCPEPLIKFGGLVRPTGVGEKSIQL